MTNATHLTAENREVPPHIEQAIVTVRGALEQLRYGTISLTVHEGRVVQIDVTEKMRLQSS